AQVKAQSGIYESYAILSVNGGANKYYDMNAATGNTDFNGNYLGNFFPGSSLVVKGGQNKTFKCGGCDITNGFLQYRVYLTSGGPSGTFTGISMNFVSNDAGGCGGNQTWEGTGGTTNIIGSLGVPGNYTLEVYSTADYQFCGNGTNYSNNGGANYKATFNYCNSNTLRTAASLDCENSVIPTYGNTFASNCGIIATVVPQGVSPISGMVNACVYTYTKAGRHPGAYTVYAPRVYDIEPAANATTATARVTLYYTQSDFDEYDTELGYDALPNSGSDPDLVNKKVYMVLTKYSNNTAFGSFSDPGSFINPNDADIVWNSARNWWEISFDNTGFSEFYLHTGVSILNDKQPRLSASARTGYNELNWMLPCGSNIQEVYLQKQMPGGAFNTIRRYMAASVPCGRTVFEKDHSITEGASYYRLVSRNTQAQETISPLVKVEQQLTLPGMASIQPNPVNNLLLLRYKTAQRATLHIQVLDVTGRTVMSTTLQQNAGIQQHVINTQPLQPGLYLLTIKDHTGKTAQTMRFVKE
ncbi:MAG: T9SS type A sorting domain-containing protein, partial [Dinghuibacter sp.]|nr:T9SS type A sorting domain-containing protein [Dinghuibacter sp.]